MKIQKTHELENFQQTVFRGMGYDNCKSHFFFTWLLYDIDKDVEMFFNSGTSSLHQGSTQNILHTSFISYSYICNY